MGFIERKAGKPAANRPKSHYIAIPGEQFTYGITPLYFPQNG
jgi:hypothetical protein